MPIGTNRTLGGVGCYLMVLGVIGTALSIVQYTVLGVSPTSINPAMLGLLGATSIIGTLSFVGFILFLISMFGFSRDYNDHAIFNNILYGIIGAIISAAVIFGIWFAFALSNIFSNLTIFGPTPSQTDIQSILSPYFGTVLPFASIAGFVWALFIIKAFNRLADKSEVPQFKTVAKLLLAGAIINIIAGIIVGVLVMTGTVEYRVGLLLATPGGIVQYVAWAVAGKAFFAIKPPTTQPFTATNIQPVSGQVKYCPNCESANQLDSAYCIKCGRKL